MTEHSGPFRIVLTGGPGGGKTTAADLFRREIGERVVVVPEAATMLFSGGFPRVTTDGALRSAQSAIYHLQRNLEDVQASRFPDRVLLCDRGTVDGAAYWPETADDFFGSVGSSLEAELDRYDAVIFFQTAARGGNAIEGGNPVRVEDDQQAIALDDALHALWSQHSQFTLVPHSTSFIRKIMFALASMESLVARMDNGGLPRRERG